MRLPRPVHRRLAQEYEFSAVKMRESGDPLMKMYFFSAFYGEAGRALNIAWDADLALLHMVTQQAHQQINQRVQVLATGADRVVGLPPGFMDALTNTAAGIAALFGSRKVDSLALHRLLATLAELTYVTTGNGYYLYLRGAIKPEGLAGDAVLPSLSDYWARRRRTAPPKT